MRYVPRRNHKPYTKSQTLTEIAENTGLSKTDIGKVVEELSLRIERHIKEGS